MNRRNCLRTLVMTGFPVVPDSIIAANSRLRIGLTPVILADQAAFLSRWGRYLTTRVGCEVSFIARDSYQVILDLLFSGQIDAAWICGYPYIRYEAKLSLLAVPLYLGLPTYQAYLIRPKNAKVSINGWADLRDKVLALSDPLSNSGWLVAQAQLAKVGINTSHLKRTFFAHGHRNVADAVAARLAHAGSIDGYVWETMFQQNMAAAAQTEVVWKSELYGFPPLVTRIGASNNFLPILQKSLLSMTEDTAGRDLLKALNLTGFTEGTIGLFESIRKQAQTVPGSGVVV